MLNITDLRKKTEECQEILFKIRFTPIDSREKNYVKIIRETKKEISSVNAQIEFLIKEEKISKLIDEQNEMFKGEEE